MGENVETQIERTDAYRDGLADGEEWDLDGYNGDAAKAAADSGWAAATINAMGRTACARTWGVDKDDEVAWADACDAYERGVKEALAARAGDVQ